MLDLSQWLEGARKVIVTSFCGPDAGGNQHLVLYNELKCNWEAQRVSAELGRIANLVLLQGPPEALRAEFWDKGRAVQRCGSGNIAIASLVGRYLLHSEQFSLQLKTPAGYLSLSHDRFGPYYSSLPEPQYPLTEAGLWRYFLGEHFVAGSLCGGASDYVLLELERPPSQLRLRSAQLCRFSRRALIAFYPLGSGHVQMRYFAPQYREQEDAATGSAATQVAEYLWRRYRRRSYRITQQSERGGLVRTEKHDRRVVVRGQARVGEFQAWKSSAVDFERS